jgi:heptosyltransferase-1
LDAAMKVLLVKMSSLGDVVHMLPAINEATQHIDGLEIDWVVEEQFSEIPMWHSSVRRVIPISLRRWRRSLIGEQVWREMKSFFKALRLQSYDLILDTQGLLKSALVTLLAKGPSAGHDFSTAREGLASLFYNYKHHATWNQHAISRKRSLTAQALGYHMGAEENFSYGVVPPARLEFEVELPQYFVMAFHGTTRPEKEYPEAHWRELISRVNAVGLEVLLPWCNEREHARADRLAAVCPGARVLPRLNLADMASVLGQASAVVGVDTGLMHLAAAFRKPGIGLYPATPPARFGAWSEPAAPVIENLSALEDMAPLKVAEKLEKLLV